MYINVPPTTNSRKSKEQRLPAYQCHLVNCRPFSVSCFLLLPSVCSCSAITVLHSASVAIIHVITTLLLRQPCFPCEMVAQCWQLSKIRSPLVNLNLVQWGRVGTRSSDKRGMRGNWGGSIVVLLTGRRVSTFPFLQHDIIDGDVSLNAWSPDTFEYHLQREKHINGIKCLENAA